MITCVALLRLLTDALERAGCAVTAAATHSEAIAATERMERLDLVISDVVMPGASGIEFVRLLRARRPGLPALFVSGYATELVEARGVDLGAERFLQKPFTLDELLSAVREIVGPS